MGGGRLIDRVRGAQGKFRGGGAVGSQADFEQIKRDLHNELIESLDFEQVGNTPREELAARLRQTLTERVDARQLPLNRMERERLVDEILDVVEVDDSTFEEPPNTLSEDRRRMILGAHKLDDRLLLVLDPDAAVEHRRGLMLGEEDSSPGEVQEASL